MKLMRKALLGLAGGMFAMTAGAVEFIDCNVNGMDTVATVELDNRKFSPTAFSPTPLAEHVFIARHSDKGKGNGGEATDILAEGFTTLQLTCRRTADEDTGGELCLTTGACFPSMFAPELDPDDDLDFFDIF